MLIHKKNLLVTSMSDDPSRPTLNGVYFDENCSVSTNNHVLVRVPYPTDQKEDEFPRVPGVEPGTGPIKPFIVSSEGVAKVLKNFPTGKVSLPILECALVDDKATNEDPKYATIATTDLDNPTIVKARKVEGPYPDYKQLIPVDDRVEYAIRLGLTQIEILLNALKKAVGSDKTDREVANVKLEFTGPTSAVRISCERGGVDGVIMPRRPEQGERYPQEPDTRDEVLRAVLDVLPEPGNDPITTGRWATRVEDDEPTVNLTFLDHVFRHVVRKGWVEMTTDDESRNRYRLTTDGQIKLYQLLETEDDDDREENEDETDG